MPGPFWNSCSLPITPSPHPAQRGAVEGPREETVPLGAAEMGVVPPRPLLCMASGANDLNC